MSVLGEADATVAVEKRIKSLNASRTCEWQMKSLDISQSVQGGNEQYSRGRDGRRDEERLEALGVGVAINEQSERVDVRLHMSHSQQN